MKDLTLPAPKGRGINWRDYIIYMVSSNTKMSTKDHSSDYEFTF